MHRDPFVEQPGEAADDAGLGLAALAEEDHVVTGEEGVLQLGQDGVLVANEAGDDRLTGRDAPGRVAADLLFDRDGLPT